MLPPAPRRARGGAATLLPAPRGRPASEAGRGREKALKSLPRAMHPKVTSDPSPTQCASPGHRHSADRWGLAWTSRRPLSCHSFVTRDPPAPGSPAPWSGFSRGSLHPETRNFISAPSPSRGTLPPPCEAAESTGFVTSRWQRGTRRRCCRPLGLARNPPGAAGVPRGGGCSGPARPARLPPGPERAFREGGRGGSLRSLSATPGVELVPQNSARHPNTLGKGTSSPSCSADGTAQIKKACEVEPEF